MNKQYTLFGQKRTINRWKNNKLNGSQRERAQQFDSFD